MSIDLIRMCLKQTFGYDSFRNSTQELAVKEIYKKEKHVLVCMGTGAGKSLCYQLPCVLHGAVSIVFCPLLALINDQLSHLKKYGIKAFSVNSLMSNEDKRFIVEDLKSDTPETVMLLVTPEQSCTPLFKDIISTLYQKSLLQYFVIDEAHCVSEWGHDFRPSYLNLAKLHLQFPKIPCVLLTATATQRTKDDIILQFKFDVDFLMFKDVSFRPNLYYTVVSKDNLMTCAEDHVVTFCKIELKSGGGCGIIYCRAKETCKNLSKFLSSNGLTSDFYHADRTKDDKLEMERKWQIGEVSIVVATIAFGMGIDNPNVRFVVHWNLPANICSYYQESGRAGRDGKPAVCRLYYSALDFSTLESLVQKQLKNMDASIGTNYKRQTLIEGLSSIKNYCTVQKCRHATICKYFGDLSFVKCGQSCDVCQKSKDDIEKIPLRSKAFYYLKND